MVHFKSHYPAEDYFVLVDRMVYLVSTERMVMCLRFNSEENPIERMVFHFQISKMRYPCAKLTIMTTFLVS